MFTVTDGGAELIIELLKSGSVINQKSFLIDETLTIAARCITSCFIYVIDKVDFESVIADDQAVLEDLSIEFEHIFGKNTRICLDYTFGHKKLVHPKGKPIVNM